MKHPPQGTHRLLQGGVLLGCMRKAMANGHASSSAPDSTAGWAVQGYGTVRFETNEAAQKAMEDFNGYELEGRTLTVRLDRYA